MSTPLPSSIIAEPLTPKAFASFGEVLATKDVADHLINRGKCQRFHDLARLDFIGDGQAGISIFQAEPYVIPLQLDLMERHPLGSQAFLPMYPTQFLVVVAEDNGGIPYRLRAFLCPEFHGVHYFRNTWHAVLTPIEGCGLFAVVDRIGTGNNLEEYYFPTPITVSFN